MNGYSFAQILYMHKKVRDLFESPKLKDLVMLMEDLDADTVNKSPCAALVDMILMNPIVGPKELEVAFALHDASSNTDSFVDRWEEFNSQLKVISTYASNVFINRSKQIVYLGNDKQRTCPASFFTKGSKDLSTLKRMRELYQEGMQQDMIIDLFRFCSSQTVESFFKAV